MDNIGSLVEVADPEDPLSILLTRERLAEKAKKAGVECSACRMYPLSQAQDIKCVDKCPVYNVTQGYWKE